MKRPYIPPKSLNVYIVTGKVTAEQLEDVFKEKTEPVAVMPSPDLRHEVQDVNFTFWRKPDIPPVCGPSGQESRRRRRELERKLKKHKSIF